MSLFQNSEKPIANQETTFFPKTDFPQRTSSWLLYSPCLLKQNFLTIITRQVNSAMQFLIALDASISDPIFLTLINKHIKDKY